MVTLFYLFAHFPTTVIPAALNHYFLNRFAPVTDALREDLATRDVVRLAVADARRQGALARRIRYSLISPFGRSYPHSNRA